MELSREQTAAVECRTNAVVAAGAGSGKTTVLARRFIELIRSGEAGVENILTLTFTRKAAAEMHRRIYSLLLKEQDDSPIVRREVAGFNDAQISTIDSFCSQIVRNGTKLFGIQPNFAVEPGRLAVLAERVSLDFLLEHQDNPALRRFIRANGFETVWKNTLPGIAEGYFSLAGRKDLRAAAVKQKAVLESMLDRSISAFRDLLGIIAEADPEGLKTVADLQAKIGTMPDPEDLVSEKRYSELAESVRPLKYRDPGEKTKKDAGVLLHDLKTEYEEAREQIAAAAETLSDWESTEEIFRLIDLFQDRYLEEKRESGMLNFTDVQDMAIAVLREDPDVRSFYKRQFRYIMIDEFQDNNEVQKNLLYYLAEREELCTDLPLIPDLCTDKLFFVGDEKQSIYLFRGADVSVFKGLKEELSREGGKFLELAANYRSEPQLIEFFNLLFPGVMANSGEPYEADFSQLRARPPSGPEAFPHIRIMVKPKKSSRGSSDASEETGKEQEGPFLGSDDAEAYHVARLIHESVEKKSLEVRDGDVLRPAEYSDFALLLRSSSNQVRYERMFRRRGIPYQTENVRTLFLESPVNDVYSLLRLAVYPEDRTAYAGLLRSPFVNCSDSAAAALILRGELPFETDSSALPEEERDRYAAGGEVYRWTREQYDRVPITSLLTELWYRYGYRYLLLKQPTYHVYLEYFDYLYRLGESADEQGDNLAVFLTFLEENLGKYEKLDDLDILKHAGEGVKIMTVHKSKGLEFPVVILANAGNSGRSGDGALPYYLSAEHGLTLKTGDEFVKSNYFYNLSKEEEKKKETAELKRLLYVGCTRAESHLFITGCGDVDSESGGTRSFFDFILKALGPAGVKPFLTILDDVTEQEALRLHSPARGLSPDRARTVYSGAPRLLFPPKQTEFNASELHPSRELHPAGAGEEPRLPAVDSDPFLDTKKRLQDFGDLVHFVLEMQTRKLYVRERIQPKLLARFPSSGRETIIGDAEMLARSFFESEIGILAGKAVKIEPEFDFLVGIGPGEGKELCLVNGRIDLFFETEESAFIVDYKTDRKKSPVLHAEQLTVYAYALKEFTEKPIRCFLFYLRSGEAVEMPVSGIPQLPVSW